MSEVIPEDEDRDGNGAIGGALESDEDDGEEAGNAPDDVGPGSENM